MVAGRKRGPTSAASEDTPTRYKKRAYGHSCLACRERKIKCEEVDSPPCKGCRESNTVCEPVERARVSKRSKDTETTLASFEKRLRRLESLADLPHSPSDSPLHTHGTLGAVEGPLSSHHHSGGPGSVPHTGRRYDDDMDDDLGHDQDDRDRDHDHDHHDDHEPHEPEGLGRPRYDLGSAARPVYHGELSMFDEVGKSAAASPRGFESESPQSWTEERLRAAARLRHRYATAEEGEAWMDAYFSWASPVYAVVHRPIFIRDMALDGPYFSDFLLIMIYISGIRFSAGMSDGEREQRGEQYVGLMLSMLADETMGPGKITTIQALLGLGGRQSAVGKTTQAWMLTGMAIRMMQDMGLHLPVDENKFSAEDRDMRNRLFWSAYCWDKTMSLTLGREPSLASRPGLSPDSLPDDPDDDIYWHPVLPGQPLPLGQPYPKCKLLKTFTLRHLSKLNLILESILTNMYSPMRPNARSLSFIRSASDKLESWRRDLPTELKIEAPMVPTASPPSNIVILNLLYHTIRILIYRPLLTANSQSALASSALNECRNAASGTHDVLSLWGRTFGPTNQHFLFVYCCFIAAGVDILLIRTGNPFVRDEAFQRVHLSLDILEQASTQGPGIRRGIVNIRSQLDRVTKGELTYAKEPAPVGLVDGPAAPVDQSLTGGAAGPAADAPAQDLSWFAEGDLWDHQTLIDILGAAPISTQDPFAFNTDGLPF